MLIKKMVSTQTRRKRLVLAAFILCWREFLLLATVLASWFVFDGRGMVQSLVYVGKALLATTYLAYKWRSAFLRLRAKKARKQRRNQNAGARPDE